MTAKPESNNIFLIGPMGTGKTTVGRLLAAALQWEFYDADQEIEKRTGADIPWIFDVEGEEGFRQREESVIAELTQKNRIILATGGGAILRAANRKHLKTRGRVVYLNTSIEQQLERTRKDMHRPLLRTGDPRQILSQMMKIREPLYQQVADITIHTDRHNAKRVVKEIMQGLNLKKYENTNS